MYIYRTLIELNSKLVSSFHVLPIQNINAIKNEFYYLKYKDFISNICFFEKTITQPFFDSLVSPSNQIKSAMSEVSKIFKTDATFFTTGGSTISNQIAINSLPKKCSILVQKSVHQSIHFCLRSYNLNYQYIDEKVLCEERSLTVIDTESLDLLLNESIDTVILNSQSYEGVMLDLESVLVRILCDNKNIKNIIIDEAWGGWTFFSPDMHNKSALVVAKKLNEKYGVNFVVIQSVHKSFFSLRQSGIIHVFGNNEVIDCIKESHFKLHTTSPSYPILASIELSIYHARDEGTWHAENALALSTKFRNFVKENMTLFRIDDLPVKNNSYFNDPNKVWVKCDGINGRELRNSLFNNYGIYISRYSKKHILINFHFGVTDSCLNSLTKALMDIEINKNKREMVLKENAISDCFVIPYPPGVPVIFPGQNISVSDLEMIGKYKEENTSLIYIKEAT